LAAAAPVGWFSDTGLSPSTTYFYTVRAYDNVGNESPDSNVVSATTLPAGAPTAPVLSVNFTQILAGGSYTLSWTAPAGATSYEVYRNKNNTTFSLVYSGSNTSFTHVGATAGEYRNYVRACNASGCSVNSNEVEILACPASGCL
jgi:fibronectin type 3 domain-containing protein